MRCDNFYNVKSCSQLSIPCLRGSISGIFSIPLVSTLFKTVVYVFSRIGVPLFLMISGALLFNKEINNAEDIKKFYKHNLLSLLITSEIWMFIMYWVIYIMEGHLRTESIFMSILGLLETMFLSIKLLSTACGISR